MTEQEKKDMLEKLIAEGMSPEDAEAQVAEAEEGDTAASVPEGEETAPTPEEDEDETSTAVTPVEDGQNVETLDGVGNADTPEETVSEEDSNETFDKAYVQKLRKESAKYREKAKAAEALEQQLHSALVRLDGRLADPADLPFSEEHLADEEALAAAIADLIARKPGLKAQRLSGDVGAGKRGSAKKPPADLISLIRSM